jgi:acylphosphatase
VSGLAPRKGDVAERLTARVLGDVQGVGFRWFVAREAAHLGLVGWVVNRSDGTVGVVAEGDPAALDDLLEALEVGPPAARVSRVEGDRSSATGGLDRFEIRSGSHPGD